MADSAPTGDKAYRWLHFDLNDPDLATWAAQHVPELPAAALQQAQTRPRCDRQDGGLILNLRGVNLNADGPADQMVAVRLWMTDETIVTVRVCRVFALDDLRKACENGTAPKSPMDFVLALSQSFTRRIQDVVFELAARVEDIEDNQSGTNTPLPIDMGDLRRQAIRLHRYLGPQRDAMMRLTDISRDGTDERAAQREVANLSILHVEELDAVKGRLDALHDHHDSRTSAAHGRNSYVLSIVAAVFLPLGFLTGAFGVNVGGMPGVDSPAAFTLLCLAMAGLGLGLVGVLRLLRWI